MGNSRNAACIENLGVRLHQDSNRDHDYHIHPFGLTSYLSMTHLVSWFTMLCHTRIKSTVQSIFAYGTCKKVVWESQVNLTRFI